MWSGKGEGKGRGMWGEVEGPGGETRKEVDERRWVERRRKWRRSGGESGGGLGGQP